MSTRLVLQFGWSGLGRVTRVVFQVTELIALAVAAGCTANTDSRATEARSVKGQGFVVDTPVGWKPPVGFTAWSIDTPLVRVSSDSGINGLHLLNVYSAVLTDSGDFMAGNSGQRELLIFDKSGSLVRTVGREGSGPAEFRSINWMQRFGDSVLVYDLRARRFTVFNQLGQYARSFTAPLGAFPVGVSGTTLLMRLEAPADPQRVFGVLRDTVTLIGVSLDGAVQDTTLRASGTEWLIHRGRGVAAYRVPFSMVSLFAVSGKSIIQTNVGSGEIVVLSTGGGVVRRFVVDVPSYQLSDADIASELEGVGDSVVRAELKKLLKSPERAGGTQRISDLLTDSRGNLWMRLSGTTGTSADWVVIDVAGRPLGSLLLPNNLRPLSITHNRLLLREDDQDGNESLILMNLRK